MTMFFYLHDLQVENKTATKATMKATAACLKMSTWAEKLNETQ
jgi:hypothetical protein